MNLLYRLAAAASFLLPIAPALAAGAGEPDILPVEQAFALETRVLSRDSVELHWKIADGYYLYRDRIKLKPETAGLELPAAKMPEGEAKHDDLFGDVVVYHHQLTVTQPLKLADPSLTQAALKITVQGCHELDPKICYPPHTSHVILDLPAAATAPVAAAPQPAPAARSAATDALLGDTTAAPDAATDQLPLPAEQAFVFEAIATSPNEVLARFTMPKGYYLYRDKTRLVSLATTAGAPAAEAGEFRWPKGVMHTDEHFGKVEVFFDLVEVPLPLRRLRPDAAQLELTVDFQGCQENGICYPPMRRTAALALPAANGAGAASADSAPHAASGASAPGADRFTSALAGAGLARIVLLFFIAGLGLAFTPCVFPMIPILSGIIAGAGENLTTRRALVLSLTYVLASALIFTIAGVVAGLAGKNLQAAFQQPWILWSFAGVFVLLALSMFGFYELQLPASFQSRIADLSNRQQGGSLTGVAIMGALSALIVGPCVAPPLAAAVVYIGQQRDPVLGGAALFALGLGMGAPLVVAGTGFGQVLPRAGAWMDAVKQVFGVVFLLLALWMLERILAPVWIMLMLGAIMVGSGVYLGALERLPEHPAGWRKFGKTIGVLLLALGLAEWIGALAGGDDYLAPLKGIAAPGQARAEASAFTPVKGLAELERELAQARSAGKPVMLDFYADWCVSCKEMERYTFPDPKVRSAFAGFVLLKADVTANDEADQALMQRFHIVGPPATLFFGRDGAARPELRLDGFEDAAQFSARLARAAG